MEEGEKITKPNGLVIEYFGVYKYLKKALEFYNDSNNNLINEEKKANIAFFKEIFDKNISEINEKYFKDIINIKTTKQKRLDFLQVKFIRRNL